MQSASVRAPARTATHGYSPLPSISNWKREFRARWMELMGGASRRTTRSTLDAWLCPGACPASPRTGLPQIKPGTERRRRKGERVNSLLFAIKSCFYLSFTTGEWFHYITNRKVSNIHMQRSSRDTHHGWLTRFDPQEINAVDCTVISASVTQPISFSRVTRYNKLENFIFLSTSIRHTFFPEYFPPQFTVFISPF